jgi:hypothetical protein
MTQAQWIYYFAAELAELVPGMPFVKAVAFGRASRQLDEPERAARAVSALLRVLPRAQRRAGSFLM